MRQGRNGKPTFTLRDVEFKNTINIFKSVIIDECHKVKSTSTASKNS